MASESLSRWGAALLSCLVAGSATACASGPSAAPTTSASTVGPRITDADDARRQLEQLEQKGECLELESAYLAIRTMPVALTSDPTEEKLKEFREAVANLRQKLPEAARTDYDLVGGAYEAVITRLDGLDLSDPSKAQQNAPKVRDALAALDEAKVKAAESRLDAFFRTCSAQQL